MLKRFWRWLIAADSNDADSEHRRSRERAVQAITRRNQTARHAETLRRQVAALEARRTAALRSGRPEEAARLAEAKTLRERDRDAATLQAFRWQVEAETAKTAIRREEMAYRAEVRKRLARYR